MRTTHSWGWPMMPLMTLTIAACGSTPPPTRSQAEAQAVIRSAEAVGARETPRSAYYLELARQHFERAQRLIAAGDMEEASGSLARAKADAELAISLSEQEEVRERAEESRERLDTLENERHRGSHR